MALAVNETSVFTLSSITDTNEHDLPDTDGDDKASAQDPYDVRGQDRAAVYVKNEADQALTARLERAHSLDESFTDPITDTSGVSVPSGETKVIAADPDVPMGYLRLVISFDSAPSSTDPSVTARYQSDKYGT